jgi:hypothetical protein
MLSECKGYLNDEQKAFNLFNSACGAYRSSLIDGQFNHIRSK